MTRATRQQGFTLVEVIVVALILGIMASFLALVVIQPFRAADDITQRARLTDQLDLVMNQIQREVRTAVPNSVRVDSTNQAVEFVPSITGGRYRRLPGGGGDPLNRALSCDTFDVLGSLPSVGGVSDLDMAGSGGEDCAIDDQDCINVFNTGQAKFDIYQSDQPSSNNRNNIAKIRDTECDGSPTSAGQITYENDGDQPAFNAHSPNQRFFVFDDVVSFVCDGGDLLRFASYGLNSSQSTSPTGGTERLVIDDLTDCAFTYDPGAATRQGLLKIELKLKRNNEAVELFHQIHVVNVP